MCSSDGTPRAASRAGNSVISRVFQRGANLPVYTSRSGVPAASAPRALGMSASIGGSSTHLPQAAGMLPSRKQRSSSVWHSR